MKKIAIITGASSGMGRDFALQLSQYFEADELWLIARRLEKLEETVKLINDIKKSSKIKKLPEPKAIEMDISGRKGVEAFKSLLSSEKTKNDFCISVLVNNAGFGTYGEFADTPVSRELDMIDLNCTSLTGFCGEAIPYMTSGSQIINTASLASFLPLGNFAVYGATKSFVLSFSIALSAELKSKGIKVLALCPGPVSTEFANVASNGARKAVLHGKSSEKVVRHALKKAVKGKKIALYSFKWKFKAFASSYVDRYLGAWFTYKFCKRPCNKE